MSDKIRVLMVDDEPNVLSGYRRTIGRKIDLLTAESGSEGLRVMQEKGPFHVVFSDMRMPEMDGVEFLKKARALHPKTVYVMLTGNADQQTAIDAINQGQIFRFLNKPCDPIVVEHTIKACKNQFDLIHAEAELLNNTLSGTVKLLIEAMVISDPLIADIVRAVRANTAYICKELHLHNEWRYLLSSSLFLLGGITVPRTSPDQINSEEYINAVAHAGTKLLRHITRFEEVSRIITGYRNKQKLPEELLDDNSEASILIGSQILRLAYEWYRATKENENSESRGLLQLEQEGQHDPRLIEAARAGIRAKLKSAPEGAPVKLVELHIRELEEGMVVGADILSEGVALVTKDQVLSQLMIDRLRGFARAGLIEDKIMIAERAQNGSSDQMAA